MNKKNKKKNNTIVSSTVPDTEYAMDLSPATKSKKTIIGKSMDVEAGNLENNQGKTQSRVKDTELSSYQLNQNFETENDLKTLNTNQNKSNSSQNFELGNFESQTNKNGHTHQNIRDNGEQTSLKGIGEQRNNNF